MKRTLGIAWVAVAATVLLASAVNSMAAVTLYDDFSSWQAAVGQTFTEPFNPGGLQPFDSVRSSDGGIGPARGVLSGSVWQDSISSVDNSSTTFTYLQGQLYGAGAFWDTSVNADGAGVYVGLNNGWVPALVKGDHGGFIGWTSTDPFTSITLYGPPVGPLGGGETLDLDNLVFAPIPEPSCALLLPFGAVVFYGLRRRAKFATAA